MNERWIGQFCEFGPKISCLENFVKIGKISLVHSETSDLQEDGLKLVWIASGSSAVIFGRLT